MAYVRPGVTTITSGADPGIGTVLGLTGALVGSAPMGPSGPTPISSMVQGLSLFGDDLNFSDFQGWSIPEAIRMVYENNLGLAPNLLVCRAGVTNASVLLGNGGATTGAWTATVIPTCPLGGSGGNGMTLVYQSTGGGTFTITPPSSAPANVLTEVYTGLGATATWAQIAAVVNAKSQLVNLTLSGTDGPATAGTTTNTLASGTDGANATAAQINATVDTLMQKGYGEQPIHIILPLFSDNATTGVTAHALTDAVAMLTNGSYQRPQVFGSFDPSMSVSAMVAYGPTLTPTENGGDSGRCSMTANRYPWRTDPATGQSRLYPPWIVAAGYMGQCLSLPPASPRGRRKLAGIDRVADGYAFSDETSLLAAGFQVLNRSTRWIDQVTTANLNSYRREQTVQAQEDVWVGLFQWGINTQVVETQAGTAGIQYLDAYAGTQLLGYQEQGLLQSASHITHQSTGDARQAEEDVTWAPILPLRNVTLRTYLAPASQAPVSGVVTF